MRPKTDESGATNSKTVPSTLCKPSGRIKDNLRRPGQEGGQESGTGSRSASLIDAGRANSRKPCSWITLMGRARLLLRGRWRGQGPLHLWACRVWAEEMRDRSGTSLHSRSLALPTWEIGGGVRDVPENTVNAVFRPEAPGSPKKKRKKQTQLVTRRRGTSMPPPARLQLSLDIQPLAQPIRLLPFLTFSCQLSESNAMLSLPSKTSLSPPRICSTSSRLWNRTPSSWLVYQLARSIFPEPSMTYSSSTIINFKCECTGSSLSALLDTACAPDSSW